MRKLIAKAEAPPKKKKADEPPPPKITHGQVWVSERFVGWQEAVLHALQVRLLFCYVTLLLLP
jgi:leucyl-tRNA synthetase